MFSDTTLAGTYIFYKLMHLYSRENINKLLDYFGDNRFNYNKDDSLQWYAKLTIFFKELGKLL
jgi:hypothetical protein